MKLRTLDENTEPRRTWRLTAARVVLFVLLAGVATAATPPARRGIATSVTDVVAAIAGQTIAPTTVTATNVSVSSTLTLNGPTLSGSAATITTGANQNFTATGTLRAGNDVRTVSDAFDDALDIGTATGRWRTVYNSRGVLTAGVFNPVAASIDGGISLPRIQWGVGTLTANAYTATFNPAFATSPACRCSHVNATPIACGPAAQASTSAVTFNVPAGTGTINWECVGDK